MYLAVIGVYLARVPVRMAVLRLYKLVYRMYRMTHFHKSKFCTVARVEKRAVRSEKMNTVAEKYSPVTAQETVVASTRSI